jgi:hypothetical protein
MKLVKFENFNYFKLKIKNLQEKIDQVSEMGQVMRKAIDLDDKTANYYEERIRTLECENEGLKEILKIKNTYEVPEEQ